MVPGGNKDRSNAIDRQLEDDSRKFKKECKILLLGECSVNLGFSGKEKDRSSSPCGGRWQPVRHRFRVSESRPHPSPGDVLLRVGMTNRDTSLIPRLRGVRQIYDCEADEDHPPEWVLQG